MGITTLTANQPIQPTKPYAAYYTITNGTVGAGTYYTVLNVTSGKGMVSKLFGYFYNAGSGYAAVSGFRITVDGGTALTVSPGGSLGYLNGTVLTSTVNASQNFLHQNTIYFTKSVLVEVYYSTGGSSSSLEAVVNYSLV